MRVETVGIVGHGHFGAFVALLVRRFFPQVRVRIYSRRATVDENIFFSKDDVARSDVVFLCGGISEYEAQLLDILALAREDTVIVDVATVKQYTTELFRTHAPQRLWLSCHPMFGPESYEKREGDVSGFRIVVTDHTLPVSDYEHIKTILTTIGFSIIELSADVHDRLLAETLFLTHYISQSFTAAGFGRTPIDTVSFQSLMNAVESVAKDTALFEDVYRFNPYCTDAANRLHVAQEQIFKGLRKE